MRHYYRIWLISADGLVGRREVITAGKMRTLYYTQVLKPLSAVALTSGTADWTSIKILRREYRFERVEGRKLWYREVLK